MLIWMVSERLCAELSQMTVRMRSKLVSFSFSFRTIRFCNGFVPVR
jgi:hypothetical protein